MFFDPLSTPISSGSKYDKSKSYWSVHPRTYESFGSFKNQTTINGYNRTTNNVSQVNINEHEETDGLLTIPTLFYQPKVILIYLK